jgi:hypothetical protein
MPSRQFKEWEPLMKQFAKFTFIIFGLVLLAACGQQPTNQALPTVMPTEANAVAATATQPATAAPTQPSLDRPTLPPTWTASPAPTEPPTATVDSAALTPHGQATLVVCGGFAADREHSMANFTAGSPVQVFWTAVATAASYRISLRDSDGNELFVDYVTDPNYTFKAELFERGKRYAWAVIPLDANKVQMCFERGNEILPP